MKDLIILIPGNPSVPGIYEPFLQQLIEDIGLQGEAISKILPHLGQCNEKFIKHKKVSVYDVIEDHKHSILSLYEKHQPKRLFLIGHSLGSGVTISLHNELSDLVDEFIILCPFLGPSKNNVNYLRMFRNPVTRLWMKNLSHSLLLNKKVSKKVFQTWLGENPFNEHIPREIKKPYYIRNFFSLVSHYIEDFNELQLKNEIKVMNAEKSFFLFAPNDYWVPDETINFIPKNSSFRKLESISHDFCLKKEQYLEVSKAVSQHILAKN